MVYRAAPKTVKHPHVPSCALIIIDVQNAIDHPWWRQHGDRNHPHAEANIAHLLASWRERKLPVYHVRHDSRFPDSPYRPDQPGISQADQQRLGRE